MEMSPSWRLAKIQFTSPFGWHELIGADATDVCTKLAQLEQKTWKEILYGSDRYYYHQISCKHLCKEAQEQLADLALDDLELLVSLRLSSTQRVWGFLDHNVLNLLWWDPQHLVYPVQKKNT